MKLRNFLILFTSIFICSISFAQKATPVMQYSISIPQPQSHNYHVQLQTSGWQKDTLDFKLPQWMPGYYQLMNYAADVENITARMQQGNAISIIKINTNTWRLTGIKNKAFLIDYNINTKKQFVANSYVDSAHAYLVATNSFLY